MGGGYLGDAGTFLVDSIFGLYMVIVLLRLWFQLVRADFYNPISQFIVTVTNPPVKTLRRLVPGLWGIDLASLVLLVGLALVKFLLIFLVHGDVPGFFGLVVLAVGDVLRLAVYAAMVAVLVRIVLSWVAPQTYNPVTGLVISVTEPLMAPARRLIPAVAGLDLSPILIFLVLGLLLRVLVQPILDYGFLLSR